MATEADIPAPICEANSSTIGSNEESKEKSMIEVDVSEAKIEELLEKENEKTSLPQPLVREASDDEAMVMHEARIEDGEPRKAELCEIETSTENMLLEIESKIEKPEDSLHVASEDIKTSDSSHEISSFGEESATAHPQDGKTDDKAVDADEIKEEIHENTSTSDSNEKTKENSLIQVGGHLEKDSEKPSWKKYFVGNANDDELTVTDEIKPEDVNRTELLKEENIESDLLKEEVHVEKPVQSFLAVVENNKASDLGQYTETTGFPEDQSLTKNPLLLEASSPEDINDESTIMHEGAIGNEHIRKVGPYKSDKNIDSTLLKKENLQEVPEENLLIQVDCSQKERLEKERNYSSLTEALMEETKHMHEPKDREEDLIKAELSENERNTVSTLVKEEAQVEKHTDSFQAALDDIKASDSTHDTKMSSDTEESLTADQQEITGEKSIDKVDIQKEVLENSSTIGSKELTEEKSMIEVDGSETKIDELLEKESEKTSLPQPLAREASDNESMVMHEGRNEDREPRKPELCEIETSTESMLLEIESKIEKPEDSLNVASEDIKTSDSSHEIETSFLEEQSATAHPQDEKTDDKALDAAEIKEEIHENVQTIVSNEKTEENSLIQVDGPQKKDENMEKDSEKPSLIKDLGQEIETSSFEEQQIILDQKTEDKARDAAESKEENLENVSTIDSNETTEENLLIQVGGHLEKDNEKPYLIKDFIGSANDDELTVMDEVKPEDVNRAELFEKEENIESDLLKEKVHVEKPVQSFPAVLEDNKVSDLGQHTETTSFHEVQGLTENPQGTLSEKTEETTDAADTKKRTQERQNVAINVSNEDNDNNSSIQLDASQMKHDTYLEKEIGKPHLIEASTEDINDESTIMHEAEIGNESIRQVDSYESDKNIDSTLLKKEKELHVATKTPHEHTEENLPVQVDCSQMEHEEHLGKESENLSLTEASLKKYTDSLQAASDDIKASNSTHDTKMSAIEKEILTADPREISNDKKEETTDDAADTKTPELQDIATNIPDGDNENNSLIEEDGLEKQSLKEVSLGKSDDNVSAVTHEANFVDEHLIKADLLEKEKHEGTLVKEEVPIESLQVADEDIKASTLVQEREKSYLEEQSLTTNPQEIIGDNKEDKTNDATVTKEETHEDKDVATNVPNWDNEDNLPIEVDGLQKLSLKEASMGNTNDDESTNMHDEVKFLDENLTKPNLFENEKSIKCTSVEKEVFTESLQEADEDIKACASCQDRDTISLEEQDLTTNPQRVMGDEDKTSDATNLKEETPEEKLLLQNVATIPHEDTEEKSLSQVDSSLMEHKEHFKKESESAHLAESPTGGTIESTLKEEAPAEKSIECFQIVTGDIKASASSQHTEISSKEEQIPPANPQEISCDKLEEKTTDASYKQEELSEDIVPNVPSGDNEDNSPVEVHCLQEPSLKAFSTGNSNDVEPPIIHEPKFEDENLVKSDLLLDNEKDAESILGKGKVSIETSSREVQSLTTNSQEIASNHKEDKTIDATELEEENPQDKNIATTTPYEEAEENLLIQADWSQTEHSEYLEKETANPSLTEAQTGHTTESTLLKEESEMEKLLDSVQVPTENIKAFTSSQDTKTSSIEQQILTVDPQEISCGKTKESIVDVTDTKEETLEVQDIAINVPSGDKENYSPTKADGSQYPSLTEASTGNATEVQDIAINVPSGDKKDSSPTKIDGSENPSLTEASTGNVTEVQDIATNIPSGDNEDNTPTKVDSSEEPSLTEASTENVTHHESENMHEPLLVDERFLKADVVENEKNTDDTLIKEELSNESLKVTTEDIKASASGQDREPSSQEEHSLIENPQEIMDDNREDKTIDATDLKEETSKEMASNSVAVAIPSTKDSDVNTDTVVDIDEDHDCKQAESSITTASEEHMMTSNEPSEQDIDKTDPTESIKSDAQVAYEENKAELKQQDTETGASQDVSDSSNSVALKEVSSSNVASEKGSIPNPSLESRKETWLEAENEEAQKTKKDVEAKIDYEAPEIIQTALSATENQEVESISVGETSASISQCERDDYEHAHIGTEEKPNSKEVGFTPEESKSDHEAKNQGLESIGQVQSCSPISKAEENLEAAAEIKSETVILQVEDIFEPKETMKVNISSEKNGKTQIKEDEDVQNDRLGSLKEKAIRESHLDQVSKDKAVEEPEENLQASESKEQENSIEEDVTKVSDTGEIEKIENVETKVSSEEQEAEANRRATVSETLKQEIEEQQLEKYDEDESNEQRRTELGSEAPVMVDTGDADVMKVVHKKSHNILSGVGSKVKNSIAKVKKAITGKSSHPKPPSPK